MPSGECFGVRKMYEQKNLAIVGDIASLAIIKDVHVILSYVKIRLLD